MSLAPLSRSLQGDSLRPVAFLCFLRAEPLWCDEDPELNIMSCFEWASSRKARMSRAHGMLFWKQLWKLQLGGKPKTKNKKSSNKYIFCIEYFIIMPDMQESGSKRDDSEGGRDGSSYVWIVGYWESPRNPWCPGYSRSVTAIWPGNTHTHIPRVKSVWKLSSKVDEAHRICSSNESG